LARTAGSVGVETARRIRKCAERLFAAQGYAAVSMRQIAGEVGVQAAALYNHFHNKQALLEDLMVNHMQALIDAWTAEAVESDDPIAALERFARFHIRYHSGRSDAVFISYMELRNLEPGSFKRVEKLRKQYEAFVVSILDKGASGGDFDVADTRIAAMAIIAMLTGVNTWYRQRGRLSLSEIEDIYTHMVLRSAGVEVGENACLAAE
jgi:AcrR family transcriptional regulator